MGEIKLISVIIPVYRVEKYIEACIRSMIGQDDSNFELILVNDGSPDKSLEIAETLLKDSQVIYKIINTENHGVSSARNTGFGKATGEYVIYVDSDDYVSCSFIRDLNRLSSEYPDSDVLFCDFLIRTDNNIIGHELKEWYVKEILPPKAQCMNLDREIKFLLPTMLIKREYLQKNGIMFDEEVKYSEDIQYIWKVMAFTDRPIVYLKKTLYYYIFHSNSTMSASGIEKILTGCEGIIKLEKEIKEHLCERCRKELVNVWFFQMFHGVAKMLSYEEFKELYTRTSGRQYLRAMLCTKKIKILLTVGVALCNLRCGYYVMRKF